MRLKVERQRFSNNDLWPSVKSWPAEEGLELQNKQTSVEDDG